MPTVRTNDVETHYERRGEGPPVVFAHGGTMDHRWWEPQVEALVDDYEVVTYDLRGHGRTGGTSLPQYTMGLYALDLHALVDELDLDRPVVVGHSLGGMFATRYATTFPDDLRGLVLADAQVGGAVTRSQRLLNRVVIPVHMAVKDAVGERGSDLVASVARLLIDDEEPDEDDVDDDLAAYAEETDEMVSDAELRKMMTAVRRFEGPDLSAIDVPTLGLYGEEGPALMRENAAELDRAVPQSTVRLVAGTGHALTWERPEVVNRQLRSFLAEAVDGER